MKLHRDGVAFGRVLTLGRQTLYLDQREYDRITARLGTPAQPIPTYAEPLLSMLGATDVDAIDASGFEEAALVHDLNVPVPEAWHERYDVIIDAGTLEHVFNVPVALASVIQMLRTGGRFLSITPTDGWGGHGFYQYSPELFWRAFSPLSGCSIVEMYATSGQHDYYSVAEPAVVKARVELCSSRPATLMVHARRDRVVRPFAEWPQQSDYVAAWSSGQGDPPARAAWKQWPLVRDILQRRRHWRYVRQRSLGHGTSFARADLSY